MSSLLFKLEAITVLRRTYEHHKANLDSTWLTKKTSELEEFLQEIGTRIIDDDIEKLIFLKKELSFCRTLDAIHVATAFEMSKLVPPRDFFFCTFDGEMRKLAKLLKFQLNDMRPEHAL